MLSRVRRQGYAVNVEESEHGVGSIAVAINDDPARTTAAISCSASLSRLTRSRIGQISELMLAVTHGR